MVGRYKMLETMAGNNQMMRGDLQVFKLEPCDNHASHATLTVTRHAQRRSIAQSDAWTVTHPQPSMI